MRILDHELVFNHEQFAVGMIAFQRTVGRFTNVCLVLFLVTLLHLSPFSFQLTGVRNNGI